MLQRPLKALRVAFGTTFCLFLLVVPSLAGDFRDPSRFREQLRERVPVSGGIRKGVFLGDPDQKVDLDRLRVEIPEGGGRRLCVEIESRDGAYFAELEYRLEQPAENGFALRLPTHYASFLENKSIRELAVLAYLSDECPGSIDLIIPVSWGDHAEANLTILVNSQDAEVRIFNPETQQHSACRPAPGTSHLSYDTECTLALPRHREQAHLVIDRRRYETRLKPIQLLVYMP